MLHSNLAEHKEMKTIFKSTLLLAIASAFTLTGCIDEVNPTSGVDQKQLDDYVDKGDALIHAMPGFMINWNTQGGEWHGDFGYSSMMHGRDFMTGDMTTCEIGLNYNQWPNFEEGYFTESSAAAQWIWNYYNKQVLTCNKAAQYYDENVVEDRDKGARATALAFRAMLYLDMARWYEFLPNDVISSVNKDGNDVLHLTVPIVTEKTTEEQARNNPRATRQQMFDFIKSDLDYAVDNIDYAQYGSRLLPDLGCVYGLYARLYMWVENYTKAAEYADLAINASGRHPLSKDEWLNTSTGFNTLDNNNDWMWALKFEKENEAVQTGICNWTSFMSCEAEYGYAGTGAAPAIDASMYARISDTDFRKLSFVAPSVSSPLVMDFPLISEDDRGYYVYNFPYATLKFRPGSGNCTDVNAGSSVAVPVMRVEEMYFIKFEALAHTTGDMSQFKQWMIDYRDPQYTTTAASKDEMVEEIVFQKRVELWGEGQTFWDIKRLNYSVTRAYPGTNFYEDVRFNTNGRPAWTNMVIVQTEGNNNEAVAGWNNPDIAMAYDPIM